MVIHVEPIDIQTDGSRLHVICSSSSEMNRYEKENRRSLSDDCCEAGSRDRWVMSVWRDTA